MVARLMGWAAADRQLWLPSGHSSDIESVQMRESVLGQAQLACGVTWLGQLMTEKWCNVSGKPGCIQGGGIHAGIISHKGDLPWPMCGLWTRSRLLP